MSMEISNGYENHYLEKVPSNPYEKAEKIAKNHEKENSPENIPIPKDEYISSEKSDIKPSGLYRMGQDEKGNPKIIYDEPEKAKKGKDSKSAEEPEKITANTDNVDREIEKLKKEKKQLEQQIKAANGDEEKIKELQEKLAQIEGELTQKDNDTYRRQNAVIS